MRTTANRNAPTSTRVICYVRVSSEKQADSGLSLEAQRTKLAAYCTAMDLSCVEVIEDAGESAKSLDRPGLQRALGLLRSGKADAILVTKLDRLTRSVRDLGDLVENYFDRAALMSVGDSIDTRSAAGRLVLNVLASVSQWEREAIGERTSEALQAKRARGERAGEVPFGFTATPEGRLIVDATEAAVIDRIRALRGAGVSFRSIVATLEREGHRGRTGRPLGVKQVHRIASAA
jgi:DNA invertase Pin-like site-specific DNA recombinase